MSEKKDSLENGPDKVKTFPCDEALRKRLREFREANPDWNNSRIAAEVGYTVAVISQYLNPAGNVYGGDTQALEKRIREFMRDRELLLDTGVPTIACEVSEQIARAVEEIRTAKRLGVIIGAPGIGKTRGIDLYCRDHELAIRFAACTWERNLMSAIDCLFRAAEVGRGKSGINAAKILAEKLRGSSRPILIDDAHKLTRPALQFFYDFRDATGSPIALFGDERLISKLQDDAQRLRRTGLVFRLKVKDPEALISHHITEIIPDLDGEAKELEKLGREIVAHEGIFGSLQMELSLAVRIKRGRPEWTWCECVRRAHKRLIRTFDLQP